MPSYLLDTNHCIYLLNGMHRKPQYRSRQEENTLTAIRKVPDGSVFLSEATLGELYFGAYKSQKRDENLKKINDLKHIAVPIPLNEAAWELFGKIKADLQGRGITIEDIDLLIACCAGIKNLTLVSNDEVFKYLPATFQVENWAEPPEKKNGPPA